MIDSNSMSAIRTRYRVKGMDCAACATKIETAVSRLPGVERVDVSVSSGTVRVAHSAAIDRGVIPQQIAGLGYPVERREDLTSSERQLDKHESGAAKTNWSAQSDEPWWRSRKGRFTIACGSAVIAAYVIGRLVPATERWAFLAAVAVGLLPIARRAFSAARFGTPFSIEMLMTIAAVGAVIIGAAEEAATVIFLFLIGELLEGVAAGRARASIQSLTALVPSTALLEINGETREVQADSVSVGAIVLIRPGDRVPADGVIVSGESSIDEAPVTCESVPVRKGPAATVFAGTVNGDGVIRIRVIAAAADNTIARVVRLVEEAQDSKAPTERFIDRFSRYYTPGVVVAAALVAIVLPMLFDGVWSGWIYKGLAILLIGCPCALVISTPAAIAASLSAGARRGLLMKGGAVLERLGTITAACFDKTGTLTEGKPKVTDVVAFNRSNQDVLKLAVSLEVGSSHPLATAILARAKADSVAALPAVDVRAIGGRGVSGVADNVEIFLGSAKAAGERAALSPEQSDRISALNDEGKTVLFIERSWALKVVPVAASGSWT